MDRLQKRSRSDSDSSGGQEDSEEEDSDWEEQDHHKQLHLDQQSSLTCHLPPTCHLTPTHHSSPSLLVSHQKTYHSHQCHSKGCGRIFPDSHLLQLHQKEFHDPLISLRSERGERVYECLHPSCTHHFKSPKSRRLHAIDVHQYPKEYFFGVVRWGIGDLSKGLIRGEWKARPTPSLSLPKEEKEEKENGDGVDELVKELKGTSIGLVPRSVKVAQAAARKKEEEAEKMKDV